MILHHGVFEEDIPINSANYSLTLTPLNGRKLCTFHGFDEYEHCDWEGVPHTTPSRETRDGLTLTCPDNPSSPPDTSYGTSNVNLQISNTCPYVVAQLGCSRYADCTVEGYSSSTPSASFVYPWLSRMRVKAVGSGWTRAHWSVSYADTNYGGPWSYSQRRGEFLDITPQPFAGTGDIKVTVDCQTIHEVRAINDCQFPVLRGKPSVEDLQVLQPWSTSSFDIDQNEIGVIFTTLDGQYLCSRDQRTNAEACGYDTIAVTLEAVDTQTFQLSCPNGNPPPLDLSGATIPIEVQGNFFDRISLALQVGCEPGEPCNAFHFFADFSPSPQIYTIYPMTSPPPRLRVKAFGAVPPARLYLAIWSVAIPDKPTVTLTQENGQWLTIDVPSDATSVYLSVEVLYDSSQPDGEPPGETDPGTGDPPPPRRALSLGASNHCSFDSVLLRTPTDPEYMVMTGNSGSGTSGAVYSDDPRMIFDSLSGRQICAVLDRTGLRECGVESVIAPNLIDGDDVRVECPDNGPPRPEADNTIPASIGTTSTSPNLAVQVGCELGNYCLSRVRSGNGAYVAFDYPMLSPMARFRVRILAGSGNGQFFSHVEWLVAFSGRPQQTYYQPRGQWFVVTVPLDATSIEISGNAVLDGTIPSGPTSTPLTLKVENLCSGVVLVGIPTNPEFLVLYSNSAEVITGDVTSNDPRLTFESLSGRQICAVLDRVNLRQCGVEAIEVSGLIDRDYIKLECADSGPPAPDAGVPIPVRITTNENIAVLVAQVGCEPGNYCLSREEPGLGATISFNYPKLSPMVRLRLRIAKDASSYNYHMAEWQVGFSGGPKRAYNVLRVDWLEIVVPSGAISIEI